MRTTIMISFIIRNYLRAILCQMICIRKRISSTWPLETIESISMRIGKSWPIEYHAPESFRPSKLTIWFTTMSGYRSQTPYTVI